MDLWATGDLAGCCSTQSAVLHLVPKTGKTTTQHSSNQLSSAAGQVWVPLDSAKGGIRSSFCSSLHPRVEAAERGPQGAHSTRVQQSPKELWAGTQIGRAEDTLGCSVSQRGASLSFLPLTFWLFFPQDHYLWKSTSISHSVLWTALCIF